MLQHLRYALRSLIRTPLVSAAAVLTLGLGIGGATAVFSVVQAVALEPLPFSDPDRLVRIWALTHEGDRFSLGDPDYLDLRAESRSLQQIAAYRDLGATAVLAGDGMPQRITIVPASASLPTVLGVHPQMGRFFSAEEDRPGKPERRLVLSDTLWRSRFGGADTVIGAIVILDDQPFVVTGVMPEGFDFPGRAEAWIPVGADPARDRGDKELAVIGRLAPGVTPAQLGAEMRDIARRASDSHPQTNGGWSAVAVPFSAWLVAPKFRQAVWVLFSAVGLLLLLACANVANLLVAQAASRHGEMRIRTALGASRRRLIQQLITESTLLALLGTAAGVLVAAWSIEAVHVLGAGGMPRLESVRIDGRVLAFACLAGAASCLIFGLVPALHASAVDLRSGMDEGLRHTGRGRLRHMLVIIEVALALLLVVGAGLMANSFIRLMSAHPGFEMNGAFAMPVELPTSRYPEGRVSGFYAELLERVRAVPGVTAAGATSTNPFREGGFSNSVTPEERAADAPPSGLVQAGWRSVTPGFFAAMGVPVLSGRTFQPADRAGTERVVVVSDTLARRLWPGEAAIGKRIYWGGTTGRTRTVIGVTGDIRDVELEADPAPLLFVPHAQVDLPSMTLVVRSSSGLAVVGPALRSVLRELDAALPAPPIHDIAASRGAAAAAPRFNLSLLAAFATIALVLAATGVYAMVAFTVSSRRRELAVRMALGASGAQVASLVLRSGLRLTLAGVLAGTLAALAGTKVLAGLLYGVAPTDPLTFVAAALTLFVVAAVACYLPAREATRVDPADILRH